MSVIFLDQLTVHYESLGRGRPVVFLHTWVGSWRYWIPSLQLAASSHCAYAMDLLGFGETARDPVGYSLDRQAALVERFLDDMGIGRIALVCHGLGALVALSFASSQLSRIARIMAIAMPLDLASIEARLHGYDPAGLFNLLGSKLARAADALPEASAIDPRTLQLAFKPDRMENALTGVRDAGIPLLLVYGANDPLLTPPEVDHAWISGQYMHQVVMPDCGHFPMLEAPDAFHRLLIDFLALEPGASPRGLQPKEEWRRRVR